MYRGFMSCHPTDSYRLFYEVVLRLLDTVRSKDIKDQDNHQRIKQTQINRKPARLCCEISY